MATVTQFNSKTFNAEAFGHYYETLPHPNKNELIKSRVIVSDSTIQTLLSSQTGSYFARIPITGRIGGDPVNYDGQTDITATGIGTFSQGVIAYGRAKAWTEKDFSYDITAGVDFMDAIGSQIAEYWDDEDTKTFIGIINGLFSMTGTEEQEFVTKHTYDISDKGVDGVMEATTLNTALQIACGEKRTKFSLVFMHSTVATNLENLKLLDYLKYTDAQGIQRSLQMATWNGRTVIIDDGMPYDAEKGTYTTYVFGEGAFKFANLGAKVPFEMSRDPKTNGGEDTLYCRRRMCFAPVGISFIGTPASLSPTNAELADGKNWALVDNGKTAGEREVYNHKDIAIARIISKG